MEGTAALMQNTQEDEQTMRRFRAPESLGRRSGLAQVGSSSSSTGAGPSHGTSREASGSPWSNGIDPTEDTERALPPPSPPIRRTSRPTVPSMSRRQSDIVLPKWQPDSEVGQCPVCKNHFTFFYRKHHCRKCGRVVCANCSPHRITIPRQFIVRPPDPPSSIIDLTGDTSPASPSQLPQLQLWGGEEVRVCNPCVPDPNLSPPPQPRTPSDHIPPEHWRFPSFDASRPLQQPPQRPRNSSGPLPPLPPLPPHAGHRSTHSAATVLASDLHRRGGHDPFRSHRPNFPIPSSTRDLYTPPNFSHNILYPPRISSNVGSSSNSLPAPSSPYRPRPIPPPPPPPRRQIAEEDECPVCGEELPPKGPNGEDTLRERHVEECIGAHLYTASPPPRTFSAPPGELPSTEASSSVSSSNSVPVTPGSLPGSSSTPLRQRRMTGGRMLVYRATEKDCVEEEGGQAECVICFEEFEEGDEMGRLECLCRFHRACIRQWWDTKGMGSCPTHQLHD